MRASTYRPPVLGAFHTLRRFNPADKGALGRRPRRGPPPSAAGGATVSPARGATSLM